MFLEEKKLKTVEEAIREFKHIEDIVRSKMFTESIYNENLQKGRDETIFHNSNITDNKMTQKENKFQNLKCFNLHKTNTHGNNECYIQKKRDRISKDDNYSENSKRSANNAIIIPKSTFNTYIKVRMRNIEMDALLDSGSVVSLIKEALVKDLNINYTNSDEINKVVSAHGSKCNIKEN
ncbi:hypothetical protein DMUE_5749 [Dictyocoela muelleri]|nr:hypothetical protein DMUE_5749 [Dictyocoela muelleri]